MRVSNLFDLPCFKDAKLLTNKTSLDREVEGINIIEAPDIENWGKKNELLLTSFFAFKDLDEAKIEHFFKSMNNIGTAGLIVKVERFYLMVPEIFIKLGNKFSIPIIKVYGSTRYEDIIQSILERLLNNKLYLLNIYYESNKNFSLINKFDYTLQDVSNQLSDNFKESLITIKLISSNKSFQSGLKLDISKFKVIKSYDATESLTNYNFKCSLLKNNNNYLYEISAKVSNERISDYIITIISKIPIDNQASYIILDNALQSITQILQFDFISKSEQFLFLNNLASSILHYTKSANDNELDFLLTEASLNTYKNYIVIGIIKSEKGPRTRKNNILNFFKSFNFPYIYFEDDEYIYLILNFKEEFKEYFKKNNILKKMGEFGINSSSMNDFVFSNIGHKFEINRLYREVLELILIKSKYNIPDIMDIREIGLVNLILNYGLSEIIKYLPPKLVSLYEKENDLFETLFMFYICKENYNLCAENLFVHPKTVRYRIDKIKNILSINEASSLIDINYKLGTYVLKIKEIN